MSTGRSTLSISSNCSVSQISGGASWITGSPRSSARQISPRRKSSPERKPRRSHSDSSSVKPSLVSWSLTSSIAWKKPAPRTSPTIGMSRSAVEHRAELALLAQHVAADVLALEDVEVGHRDRRRDRVAGEGEAVGEHRVALHERLGDAVGGDHRPHRHVGRGERLGHRDDVGLVAVALAAEPVAEPAPGADHLVGDQQHVVAVADLAHALEVAVLRTGCSRRRSGPARGSPRRPSRGPRSRSSPRSASAAQSGSRSAGQR